MARRRVVISLTLLAASSIAAASLASPSRPAGPLPPMPVTGATPQPVKVDVRTASYPVFGSHDERMGSATWRESPAGGNCCEAYLTGTPTGRLVESGGTYPWYTDDAGLHWYEVKFDVPDQNENGQAIAGGEGATVVGPDGDVYGVTWDAYSGDHLMAYRYAAQTHTWSVSDVLMKSPFYDRPWLTYAAGPVTLDGARSPQLLDVYGGGITKDVDTFSPDGLDYSHPSFPYADESQSAPVRTTVPVVPNPAADWWQPYPGAHTLPLNAGGVLRFDNFEDVTATKACAVGALDRKTATWRCATVPGAAFKGTVRQDSRGYLTEVYPTATHRALVLATSRDGGGHWRQTTLRPPTGGKLETPDFYDVVSSGRLHQAVVSARFDDKNSNGQDMVFRVSTAKRRPQLLKTYLVGRGDINTANDVTGSAGYRFDYASVTLLPDGHIAVSFDDSSCVQPSLRDPQHKSPEVAILT
jgi:hypothetical protein